MVKRIKLRDIVRPPPRRVRLVGVNEDGRRIGEHHHNATIPEATVRRIFEMHEDGVGYGRIATQLGLKKSTVAKIARCERRAQFPRDWRRIEISDDTQEDHEEGEDPSEGEAAEEGGQEADAEAQG